MSHSVDWTEECSGQGFNDFEKDLVEIIDEIDKKEKQRQELVKSDPKVMIDSIKIKTNQMIESLNLDSIKRVFHFWFDGQHNYQSSKALPKLVLPEKKLKLYLDLEMDYKNCRENNGLIEDYYQYRDKKWKYFLQTIKDNNLIDKFKPHFVSFGGPIADILATVYDTSIEWTISAEKADEVIYFFKTRNERIKNQYKRKQTDVRSYCGLKFLHLITDRDDNQLNEFKKCFAINCIDFKSHKILSLNEFDAIDDHNNTVDIKLVQKITSAKDQDFFVKKKLLRFWSKALVQGIDTLIIGNMDSNNYLCDIEERKVAEIPEMCSHKWSDVQCISFLNRFFAFMKNCITEENIIYEFHFRSGEEFVVCNRINPNRRPTILPKLYIKS